MLGWFCSYSSSQQLLLHPLTSWVLALPLLQWGVLAAGSSRQAEMRRKTNSCQTVQECWIVSLGLCLLMAYMSIHGEELTNQPLLRCFEPTLKFQEKLHLDKQCKMMHSATHMGVPGKLFSMECCEWQETDVCKHQWTHVPVSLHALEIPWVPVSPLDIFPLQYSALMFSELCQVKLFAHLIVKSLNWAFFFPLLSMRSYGFGRNALKIFWAFGFSMKLRLKSRKVICLEKQKSIQPSFRYPNTVLLETEYLLSGC